MTGEMNDWTHLIRPSVQNKPDLYVEKPSRDTARPSDIGL